LIILIEYNHYKKNLLEREMMKRYILPLAVLVSGANALDLRYGQGDFEWSANFAGVMDSTITLDDKVVSISEQHQNFANSSWYYFGNIDIHSSDTLDQVTDIADGIVDLLPFAPDSIVPFPSSFEVSGVDFDIGIGYDIIQDERGYLGVGVMTGISTPFMEMHNYIDAIDFIDTILEETSTDVKTYKFGISLQGAYSITPNLSMYGTTIYATQTGEMSNDLIDGDFDVSGTYSSFDIGLKYYPSEVMPDQANFYIKGGYAYKHWDIDDIEMSIGGVILPDMMSLITTEMTSDFVYVGVGFSF